MSDSLPITYGHDDSRPIGHTEQTDDGTYLRISKEAKLTEDMVGMLNFVFAPTYEVTKVEDGLVIEVRLLGFGLVPGKAKS